MPNTLPNSRDGHFPGWLTLREALCFDDSYISKKFPRLLVKADCVAHVKHGGLVAGGKKCDGAVRFVSNVMPIQLVELPLRATESHAAGRDTA